jgi:hypothetical protein
MKMRGVLIVGFIGGAVIGEAATLSEVAPRIVTVLTEPLKWLTTNMSSPYPSESLGNLIIAIPLALIYWGCLGAAVGLLILFVIRGLQKAKRHNN